jgi:hypothetical protein
MGIDNFIQDDDALSMEEVREQIETWGIDVTTYELEENGGYSFYAKTHGEDGTIKRGTLCAAIRPGPKLVLDPSVKFDEKIEGTTGIPPNAESAPADLQEQLRYSLSIDSEIPDIAKPAFEESYAFYHPCISQDDDIK